jgi:rhamnosyltransferase
VSQAEHPEVFRGISSEGEGLRMLRQNIRSLFQRKKILYIPYLFYITGCKLTGFRLGRSFRHLPRWLIKRLSMNPEYWRKNT